MRFIDFFSGIGGFREGMQQAGHECVGFCEFDKYAVASYVSMHCITEEQREYLTSLELKKRQKEILKEEYRNGEWYANDVRSINPGDIPEADCWCFGFPCQDISVAGKQLGFNGHRSSLFFAVTKLIRELKEEDRPKHLFIENVKNLLSVNAGFDFAKLLIELDEIGYDAEWQVLNSKNFGVPQNRERCFIIGHLRGRSTSQVFPVERTDGENNIPVKIIGHKDGYRRNTQTFHPEGITEALDTAQGGGRGHHLGLPIFFDMNNGPTKYTDTARCLQARYHKGISNMNAANSGVAIPVLTPDRGDKRQNGRRFKENGEPSFTLTSQDRHGVALSISGNKVSDSEEIGHCLNANDQRKVFEAKQNRTVIGVKVKEATKQGYAECRVGGVDSVNLDRPESTTRRGRVGVDCANTLYCKCNQGVFVEVEGDLTVYAIWSEKYQCYIAVRRLTPRECFRLQGWTDDYFEKAQFVNSDSQLYKQAGNGVTVNVIKAIAERMR